MFERPQRGERAILLYVGIGQKVSAEDEQEFASLALSAGAEVVGTLVAVRPSANPRFLIGSGKLDELKELVGETDADLILVDHDLSPTQQKNLEGFLKRRVVDRSGLILDIFALRARTFEGKLQVELAQLVCPGQRRIRRVSPGARPSPLRSDV